MAIPSAQEAVTITVATPVEDLRVGDVVGPSDVALPADFTVVGTPHRPYRQRLALAAVTLRIEDAEGAHLQVFPQDTMVFVRRWRALATITRADGTTDTIRRTVRLRPVGDTTTPVNAAILRLQPGDSLSLAAE